MAKPMNEDLARARRGRLEEELSKREQSRLRRLKRIEETDNATTVPAD